MAGIVAIFLFSLEFKNSADAEYLFNSMIFLIPIAIVLTLARVARKRKMKDKDSGGKGSTVSVAIAVFVLLIFVRLIPTFGGWTDEAILYRNRNDRNITIRQQVYDVGALGYDRGKTRLVEIRPCLHYFNRVTDADIAHLDKNEWIIADEPGPAGFL